MDQALRITAVGGPEKVKAQLEAWIARYKPDEMILTGQIHDHDARVKSFGIAAEVLRDLGLSRAA